MKRKSDNLKKEKGNEREKEKNRLNRLPLAETVPLATSAAAYMQLPTAQPNAAPAGLLAPFGPGSIVDPLLGAHAVWHPLAQQQAAAVVAQQHAAAQQTQQQVNIEAPAVIISEFKKYHCQNRA